MRLNTNLRLPALGTCFAFASALAYAAEPVVRDGVLTGDNGMTLYTFARDKARLGKSECDGACAKNWPPFLAGASDSASGDYGFVKRAGDTMQWAYKGKPLYFWHLDKKPGEMKGDGFRNVWHVARP